MQYPKYVQTQRQKIAYIVYRVFNAVLLLLAIFFEPPVSNIFVVLFLLVCIPFAIYEYRMNRKLRQDDQQAARQYDRQMLKNILLAIVISAVSIALVVWLKMR